MNVCVCLCCMIRSTEGEVMIISTDGMDQAKTILPHEKRVSKDTDCLFGLPTHIVSTLCYGGDQPIIGFINTPDLTKNSCLTVTNMHRAVEMQWEAHMEKNNGELKRWPKRLHVTFDNAQGENVNQNVFQYLSLLVHHGVFKRITVGTLLIGHTHNINDQVFSVWSKYLNYNDVKTLSELMKVFSENYHGYVKERPHEKAKREAEEAAAAAAALLIAAADGAAGDDVASEVSDYDHLDASGPLIINHSVPIMNDVHDLACIATPKMELVKQNADIGSWIGAEQFKSVDLKGIGSNHVFAFDKDIKGDTYMHRKFVSNSEVLYHKRYSHPYTVENVKYRKQVLMWKKEMKIVHDPVALPFNAVETSSILKMLDVMVNNKFLTDGEADETRAICQRFHDQVEAQAANCEECKRIIGKLTSIGVIHRPSTDCSRQEKSEFDNKTKKRRKYQKQLTAHLALPEASVVHSKDVMKGWWTNWKDRIKMIKEYYRNHEIAIEPDDVDHTDGYLEHPNDHSKAEALKFNRVEVAQMESYGPPRPGDYGVVRVQADDANKPPFVIVQIKQYFSPTEEMIQFDHDTTQYQAYLYRKKCGEDVSKEKQWDKAPVGPELPVCIGILDASTATRKAKNHLAPMPLQSEPVLQWMAQKVKASKLKSGKNRLASKSGPEHDWTFLRTHIEVVWMNHTESASKNASSKVVKQTKAKPAAKVVIAAKVVNQGQRKSGRNNASSAAASSSSSLSSSSLRYEPAGDDSDQEGDEFYPSSSSNESTTGNDSDGQAASSSRILEEDDDDSPLIPASSSSHRRVAVQAAPSSIDKFKSLRGYKRAGVDLTASKLAPVGQLIFWCPHEDMFTQKKSIHSKVWKLIEQDFDQPEDGVEGNQELQSDKPVSNQNASIDPMTINEMCIRTIVEYKCKLFYPQGASTLERSAIENGERESYRKRNDMDISND